MNIFGSKSLKDRKNIGLALGGGAVRGAAHVGVLHALEEAEIKPDYIAGTSIGAFVAAFYAFGKGWEEINEIASELRWVDITRISLSRYGLLSNDKIRDLIIKHIGDISIEDSDIPLAIVATNAANGEKVVIKKGPLTTAVLASTCIPGIFSPIEEGDKMLVDGGIVESVPINTVREMGAKYVIGVDLNSKHAIGKPNNILEVILTSFHYIVRTAASLQTDDADLLIKPDLSLFSRSDIKHINDIIKQGYTDAVKVLKNV